MGAVADIDDAWELFAICMAPGLVNVGPNLSRLSPLERTTLFFHSSHRFMTSREIALLLDTTPTTVRMALGAARSKMIV